MGPGLLLLLLLLPWAALGNVGGSAGACACTHRWPREPPPTVRLPPLAPHVLRAELCPNHVTRFVLPHKRLCGLRDSPWVAELLQLWERQAQRPLAGPPATDGPTDRPPDGPPAMDGPTDRPPDGHLATDRPPGSPLAPQRPPASPTVRPSPPPHPPAPRLGEGHQDGAGGQLLGGPQALLPTPAGRIHWEGGGQDPQTPPPAVGRPPLSQGLIMGLVLLGAALGLGGVLVRRGGCWGARRGWGAGPPPPPETLTPLSCPTDVGLGSGPRGLL
ncbi:uncharacterized protein LOC141938776 isoform X2 [Strix uralensis]|uniref:uncharacterized protein LOC141938776 isoform X2 n=1 Tax=Strix uralensis TaxID=36305 RepID=UPI003DA4B98D